jgi:hypothetical protein
MANTRNYNNKDVDMLMAAKTIAEAFKANINDLSAIRTDWTAQYADELIVRIDNGIEKSLGVDSKKVLRNATAALASVLMPAYRDLSFFKLQIDDDFKKDPLKRDELLKALGFTRFLKDVQKKSQESIIQLLYMFKTNMTEGLKLEITSKGMNPALIDKIIDYAATIKQANVAQETNKGATKEITKEVRDAFNTIYDEIIGICKKASKYYQYEPLKKELFTFRRIIGNLGMAHKISEKQEAKPVV